jgi:hypothetical protein
MVKRTNRLRRSRTCFIRNFNQVKFENEPTLGYWRRNDCRFEASWSLWFCLEISKRTIDICWKRGKSSIRRSKAKIGNRQGIAEKSKNIAPRRGNIVFRSQKLTVNWGNLEQNIHYAANNYNFPLCHNNPSVLKDFRYWIGKIEGIRTLFFVKILLWLSY